MTRRELNQLKIDAYKNFIKIHYGQETLDKVNLAIKKEMTDKIMTVRSKEFDEKLYEIDEKCE